MTPPTGRAEAFLDGTLGPVPPVDPSTAGLSLATPAGSSPFTIQGRHARVSGDQRHPVGSVDLFGCGRAVDFRVGASRAANVVLFPGICRRDFVGPHGVHLETVVVAPLLPLVVIQWSGDAAPPGSIDFILRLDAPAPNPLVARSGETIAIVSGDQGLAVGTDPGRHLTLEPEGPTAFRVSIAAGDDQTLSVVLAGGTSRQVRAALAAASHLQGHVLRAATGPCTDGLSLPSGIAEVDDAFSWAKVRLRGRIDELSATPQRNVQMALELGLAAAAVGDREGSSRVLSLPSLAGTPHEAILAARHASTFGDVTRAGEVARRRLSAPETSLDDADLWRLADHALSEGLLYAASEDTRSTLRGLVDTLPRATRSLPMVGRQRPGDAARGVAAATRALLSGAPSEVHAGDPGSPLEQARHVASAFPQRPAEAWQAWRTLLASGLEDGPEGPATWVEGESGSMTAALLLAFTQGMLGMVPDAPAGRLRLAPRIPSHLSRFAVDGITLGDATATLRYRRADQEHRFVLAPQRAAVPMLVVFEPAVHGTVREVRVDGALADLDSRPEGSLTVTPVQLPLDGPRTVEITTVP